MTVFQTKSIFCGAKAQTYPQDVLDFVKSRKQLKKGNLHSLKNAKFANFKYKILVHLFARRLSLQSVKSMFTKIEIFYFFCHFLHLRRSDNSQSSDYFLVVVDNRQRALYVRCCMQQRFFFDRLLPRRRKCALEKMFVFLDKTIYPQKD